MMSKPVVLLALLGAYLNIVAFGFQYGIGNQILSWPWLTG